MITKGNILDAAWKLAKDAHGLSHADAKDKLQSLFPGAAWDDLLEAYLQACALAEGCYEVADAVRRETIPQERAILALQQKFPGFAENTYRDAFAHGLFLSR